MNGQYKDTLNLPNTNFPMKADLAKREPELLKHWDSIKLYQQLNATTQGKPTFILGDGPPYANGPIHLGHAVNKILKDFIVKSKILSGFQVPFIPGWDCHGLPIELNVEKHVGKPGIHISPKAFREKCRDYVLTQVAIQRDAFIRLGVLADWEKPYLTMDYGYEANILRSLAKIIANGHLHKGFKPVHWCVDCGSALAEAEVEYQDKVSPSIDVGFLIKDEKISRFFSQDFSAFEPLPTWVAIWTTTPWTLPANQAVAVHPDFTYTVLLVENFKNRPKFAVLVAKELISSFAKRIGLQHYQILAECQGAALEGLTLQHPFYPRTVPLVLGEHVTLETGTGFVHIAPAHGLEDYQVGKKYHLPLESLVGSNGCYLPEVPLVGGEHVFKVNEKILGLLEEARYLLHQGKIQHSYPHCWRHKTPLIFRATQQWFISMEQKALRAAALKAIQTVKWIPPWGQARIEAMVAERPDWCISRQRTWGVPMAMWVHRETGELHPNTVQLMEAVACRIEKEGVDAWYELTSEEFLAAEATHYEKVLDTLDVWFDSGISHYAVLAKREALKFPADLYLEGSDQHRGWFQSSLLTSMAMHQAAPYQQVLTHGFTVDAAGHKMSKSLGNVIAPEKVIQSLGADILRLWVASSDYRAEMAVSDAILKQISDIYRRIRNTARYLLANLNEFDPDVNGVSSEQMLVLDKFIVKRAFQLQTEIIKAYQDYQFHLVYQLMHHYCAVELGSFYLDIIKDRQYTGKKTGLPRRSAQTALYYIAECLVRWMAPILSFTAEEIWQNLPGKREDSVFLSQWYDKLPAFSLPATMDEEFWKHILAIRDEVNKALEVARTAGLIGSALEAEVQLYCKADILENLLKLEQELRFVLITSNAAVYPETKKPASAAPTQIPGLWIVILPSPHPKCERCWHRREEVNSHPQYPNICERCVENVAGLGETRKYA